MNWNKILQTYSLDEIFEYNELTHEEVLEFLVQKGFLEVPQPTPVDCYETS